MVKIPNHKFLELSKHVYYNTDEEDSFVFLHIHKKGCGSTCVCRRVGLFCNSTCSTCSGVNCLNSAPIIDQEENEEEDEDEADLERNEDEEENDF